MYISRFIQFFSSPLCFQREASNPILVRNFRSILSLCDATLIPSSLSVFSREPHHHRRPSAGFDSPLSIYAGIRLGLSIADYPLWLSVSLSLHYIKSDVYFIMQRENWLAKRKKMGKNEIIQWHFSVQLINMNNTPQAAHTQLQHTAWFVPYLTR